MRSTKPTFVIARLDRATQATRAFLKPWLGSPGSPFGRPWDDDAFYSLGSGILCLGGWPIRAGPKNIAVPRV